MHAGGYAGYLELDDMNTDEPEIGVNIMESYRRQGIGPEALLLLLPYLRANYRQQNYIGRVFSDNTDSQKMMQRIGAKLLRTEATPVEKAMEVAKRLLEDQKVVEEVMRRYANKNQTVLVYQLP